MNRRADPITTSEDDVEDAAAESSTSVEPRAAASGSQRVDKWLWYVRAAKSRTLASGLVEAGKVRINRARIVKPSATVAAGDVVTVAAGARVRVLKVVAPGVRRGPPSEAQTLFEDLTPSATQAGRKAGPSGASTDQTGREAEEAGALSAVPRREAGAGRPTKRERRQLDRLRGRVDED